MIQLYNTHKAKERGVKQPVSGGVTFVQRFGSALNLNIHFHTVALDGVFSAAGPVPVFHHLPGPTDEEVAGIVEAVAQAVISDLRAHRYLTEEMAEALELSSLDPVFAASEQLAAAVSASAVMRIAFGERRADVVGQASRARLRHRHDALLGMRRSIRARRLRACHRAVYRPRGAECARTLWTRAGASAAASLFETGS